MFALMPWTRRNALLPRIDGSFSQFPEEFGTFFDRLLNRWPEVEIPEWPSGWGLTTDENEKEFVVRLELPGFEAAEVKVDVLGDRLTVEAEHKEPVAKNDKTDNRSERTRVRRMLSLPQRIDRETMEASYRNGVLEIHIPRIPEEVGRRIEVKT